MVPAICPGWLRSSSLVCCGQNSVSPPPPPIAIRLILHTYQIVAFLASPVLLVYSDAASTVAVGAHGAVSGGDGAGVPSLLDCRRDRLFLAASPAEPSALHQRASGCGLMKLPPFIVTLWMWQIVLGPNFLYSPRTIRLGHRHRRRLLQFSAKDRHRRAILLWCVFLVAWFCFYGLRASSRCWGVSFCGWRLSGGSRMAGRPGQGTLVSVYHLSG